MDQRLRHSQAQVCVGIVFMLRPFRPNGGRGVRGRGIGARQPARKRLANASRNPGSRMLRDQLRVTDRRRARHALHERGRRLCGHARPRSLASSDVAAQPFERWIGPQRAADHEPLDDRVGSRGEAMHADRPSGWLSPRITSAPALRVALGDRARPGPAQPALLMGSSFHHSGQDADRCRGAPHGAQTMRSGSAGAGRRTRHFRAAGSLPAAARGR